MENYLDKYAYWKNQKLEDVDLANEISSKMSDNDIKEKFTLDLVFGTGGLRGTLGVGPNRMNIYTVRRAAYGLGIWVLDAYKGEKCSVSISYDSRNKSTLFAHESARVLAALGVKVYIYKQLMPTPLLSWAVRYHHSKAGIMVTASHNPKEYNGFKVYDDTGCQLTDEPADKVYQLMLKTDFFKVNAGHSFEEYVNNGQIEYISQECLDEYYSYIDSLTINADKEKKAKIVYTPLNGTGLVPVMHVLESHGFKNIKIVPEQKNPDGNFPTCSYPNPELRPAFEKAVELLKATNYDVALATDPDCDRCACAVKDLKGEIRYFTGNEIGVLLFDYILQNKKEKGTLKPGSFAVKSIVTTDMAFNVAKKYGVTLIEVLTGFKYIGEQIRIHEEKGEVDKYVFGFEESIGYLSGTRVRDKDAVDSSYLIAEMCDFYLKKGITIKERMDELYEEFGYVETITENYAFAGLDGMEKMKNILSNFRKEFTFKNIEGLQGISDYFYKKTLKVDGKESAINLPKSNVLSYYFENGIKITVRPSGTEPKMKIYYYLVSKDVESLNKIKTYFHELFSKMMQ